MNECKICNVELDNQRAHLGYTECLDCSEVEAYSAHTVFPHKTGGYVQPVSKTASNNLKKIDRRSTGSTRQAKGIYSDQSWDRWLDRYYDNLYNPKPKRKVVRDVCTIKHISTNEINEEVLEHYSKYGYERTHNHIRKLLLEDKISLNMKSNLMDKINRLQLLTRSQRKKLYNI
tara:strand:+ start:509 stop:1030 length:522 start_codon:yes stop_codon:yes gene_type:complete